MPARMRSSAAPAKPKAVIPPRKPGALAILERSGAEKGEDSVRLSLELTTVEGERRDEVSVTALAREAMALFSGGEAIRTFVAPSIRAERLDSVHSSVGLAERPGQDVLNGLRSSLRSRGYQVSCEEIRECNHPGCALKATVEWRAAATPPPSWHSISICGKHQYKDCAICKSSHIMSSTNAVGPAPSLHCQRCGATLIEWGGSKVWTAELIS
jgi:hypothetical protein